MRHNLLLTLTGLIAALTAIGAAAPNVPRDSQGVVLRRDDAP